MSTILKQTELATCDTHGTMELAAGELWPAYCHCGLRLREANSIERTLWDAQRTLLDAQHEQFDVEYAYYCHMTCGDTLRLHAMGVDANG